MLNHRSLVNLLWRSTLILTTSGLAVVFGNRAFAQIQPDNTLGEQNSIVNDIDALNKRIDGGVKLDANLFHSFQEFNVSEGGSVYFANPQGITDIFSRVTGDNPSNIFGKLGVLGDANLFLINPNGIVFGENASLDVGGSFVATTANGVEFGEQGVFSASNPETPRLLSVNPSAFFFNQVAAQPGNIVNRGNLTVDKHLILRADNLDLQGQLLAGGNLKLQADSVTVRDSIENPFIAAAKGELLVQGNQNVDIFALSHPDSGLFSGGDMVLRSANQVGGDTKYWSGGNFRIEQLDGNLGDLFSLYNPVIRSLGDVSFNNYRGASLHILAGGSVNIGTAVITEPEIGSSGFDFIQETVKLSDGTEIFINGNIQPTLDVRAGLKENALGTPSITGFDGSPTGFFADSTSNLEAPPDTKTSATNANITIGDIFIEPPNGLVYLTNQYKPNSSLIGGNITVTGSGVFQRDRLSGSIIATENDASQRYQSVGDGIDARGFDGDGSSVLLDSRADINLPNSFIDSSSDTGNGGNIRIISARDIMMTNPLGERSSSMTSSLRTGNGGEIDLIAARDLILEDSRISVSSAKGGNIIINAQNVNLFKSSLNAGIWKFGDGTTGNIQVNVKDNTTLNNSSISVGLSQQASGDSGNITINTNNHYVLNSSVLDASTSGMGNAGDIEINASGIISFEIGERRLFNRPSVARTNVQSGAIGNGGNIKIEADSLFLNDGGWLEAIVEASTEVRDSEDIPPGQGNSGNIDINVRDKIVMSGLIEENIGDVAGTMSSANAGISPELLSSGIINIIDIGVTGDSGNIKVKADSLVLADGAQINSGNYGQGKSGNINLDINGLISMGDAAKFTFRGSSSLINSAILSQLGKDANGSGGNIDIQAGSISMLDISEISASTFGEGNAGNISMHVNEDISVSELSSIRSVVESGGVGDGGNIDIQTRSLSLTDGSQVVAGVFRESEDLLGGVGNAGDIQIKASEFIDISGIRTKKFPFPLMNPLNPEKSFPTQGISSGVITISETGATGEAGNILLDAKTLKVSNGAVVTAQTENSGDSGNITINTNIFEASGGGQIITNTSDIGNAGDITINVSDKAILSGSDSTFEQRLIQFDKGVLANVNANTGVFANTTFDSQGNGGNIKFKVNNLSLADNAEISALSEGTGNAGSINVESNKLIDAVNSNISTTSAQSSGGAINITAEDIRLFGDSDIATNVFNGEGGGGDITLNANTIVALDDSDIVSFSADGKGGDINFKTAGFFSNPLYKTTPPIRDKRNVTSPTYRKTLNQLNTNQKVDVNASGTVSGTITGVPDTSFIQNSLTDLPDNQIDNNILVANSCIVRSNEENGTFLITGSGGLPQNPSDTPLSSYSTGSIRSIPSNSDKSPASATRQSWKIGDPVVEPQGVYKLPNGQLVLSRECG